MVTESYIQCLLSSHLLAEILRLWICVYTHLKRNYINGMNSPGVLLRTTHIWCRPNKPAWRSSQIIPLLLGDSRRFPYQIKKDFAIIYTQTCSTLPNRCVTGRSFLHWKYASCKNKYVFNYAKQSKSSAVRSSFERLFIFGLE